MLTSRSAYYIALILIFFLSVISQFSSLINHDVGSHLIFARKLLRGGEIGIDIVDPNPPLIFYMLTVPLIISQKLTVSYLIVFRLLVFFFIINSVLLSKYFLKKIFTTGSSRIIAIVSLVFILTLQVGTDFGQREHLLLILILPYIFLLITRSYGIGYKLIPSLIVGAVAGLGFSLKPHFLLLFVAGEVYLMFRLNSIKAFIRPDSLLIIFITFCYCFIIYLYTPKYFTLVLPIILRTYYAYNCQFITLLLHEIDYVFATILTLYLALRFKYLTPLNTLLAIALLSFWIVSLLQLKGWSYHLYPIRAIFFIYIIINIMQLYQHIHEYIVNKVVFYALCVLLIFIIINVIKMNIDMAKGNMNSEEANLIASTQHLTKESYVYVFSTSVFPAFPVANYNESNWGSRFNCLWPLPAIVKEEMEGKGKDPDLINFKRYLFNSVIEDLTRSQPDVLIVDNRQRKQALGNVWFDFIAYFSQDYRFKLFWKMYQESEKVGDYSLFTKGTISSPPGCLKSQNIRPPGRPINSEAEMK